MRIGHGYDIHRLQSGGKLVLAGVEVADDLSPIAHSDGDVVIHAVVDALLGALGRGDIGELFPNSDPQWKDAPSRVFLEQVMAQVVADGQIVSNIDVTILAERPKLKPFKQQMVEALSKMLGDAPVSIKAGTNEGCDAVGRGEAIAAHAVVLLDDAEGDEVGEEDEWDEEETSRAREIGLSLSRPSDENIKAYCEYLKRELQLPCEVRGAEDFQWEEPYVIGGWSRSEYRELKRTQPSYTDRYSLVDIECGADSEWMMLPDDIAAHVRRIRDNRSFILGLSELKAVDPDSVSARLIEEYARWFVNNR